MLDIKYVRENLEEVKKAIAKRGAQIDWEKLLELDEEKKSLQNRIETLRAEQNKLAKEGQKTDKAVEIKQMIKDLAPQLQEAEENFKIEAVKVPNIPQDDVPEENYKEIKKEGEIKVKEGKDHIELGKALDLIDIDRAAKVSGSRFYFLKNELVDLEFALIKFAFDLVKKEGFRPIIPPILIKEDMAWGTGHFEAVNDDAYHMKNDQLVAIGTSEQSILPYFVGETLTELPQRFVGFSTCLRREAGSYGKDVRGILRAHQFDKVEMISFCKPEDSKKEHELIVSLEEKIVSGLGLPYRVVILPANDMGLPSAKTVDIECWIPSQGEYRETHSSSNCTDFQARRLNIKYKDGEKSGFVHTLNGTAVAIGRILIAIMENYQSYVPKGDSAQDKLSIKVPEVLQKYLDFKEIKR